jgi:hypothetical protein
MICSEYRDKTRFEKLLTLKISSFISSRLATCENLALLKKSQAKTTVFDEVFTTCWRY